LTLLKRLIGTVLVRHGLAVQSFGYRRWLPLGTPECVVQNLDRWGADGIVVLVLDRSDNGPDFNLIKRLGEIGLSTPFTYGGGLRNEADACQAVRFGAERLVLDTLLHYNPNAVKAIADAIGAQALVAALPLVRDARGSVRHYLHRRRESVPISSAIRQLLTQEVVSEALVVNVDGEGNCNGFDPYLLQELEQIGNLPLLAFGGICTPDHIRRLLKRPRVSGVLVGNSLNYREHAISHLKSALIDQPLRTHHPCIDE